MNKSDHLHYELQEILLTCDNFFVPTLYYEILEVSLSELETKKIVHVKWQNEQTKILVSLFFFNQINKKLLYRIKKKIFCFQNSKLVK